MMRPGEAARGQRVRHDSTGKCGVVLAVLDKAGHGKGAKVEYATVRFDRNGGTSDHPTITLTKI